MTVRAKDYLRIGIDLGGTKIEGLLIGPDGTELARRRVAAPREDYDATLRTIGGVVAALISDAGAHQDHAAVSVGVGMPGSISPATGLVQNANSNWLNGRAFDTDLRAAIGLPVRFANDANCFALSEAVDGAGSGATSVFGVILGTGVGGGLVIAGRLVNGPRGTGGEWGHNALPWASCSETPGPACWCGRHGCIEAWVSGPAMARDHLHETGDNLSAEEIAARAAQGDAGAAATLTRHTRRLARSLAHVINIFDPDIVVLGGGLSQLPRLYTDLPAAIAPHLFTDSPTVRVLPPRWGDASGVRGAAWLWD
jgi:fructokinase